MAFHPDGSHVILGTLHGEIVLLDTSDYNNGLNIRLRRVVRTSQTIDIKPNTDAKRIGSSSPSKGNKSGKKVQGAACNYALADVKFSPNGLYVALAARDNCLHLLDAERGYKKICVCYGHANFVTHLDWSRDSTVFQSNSGDGELLYWDAASGKQITDTMSVSTESILFKHG